MFLGCRARPVRKATNSHTVYGATVLIILGPQIDDLVSKNQFIVETYFLVFESRGNDNHDCLKWKYFKLYVLALIHIDMLSKLPIDN
jgi:hypothetical protein